MILTDLRIHYLRSLSERNFNFSKPITCLYGPNGAGKSTFLEAIYLLSCGHSFRTRDIASLIQNDHERLTVYGKLYDETSISVLKDKSHPSRIKINDRFCRASSELAYLLPCQIIYQDIFSIIDAGPAERRSVLDWGMFHVKHSYLNLWKEMQRIVKQRNALLKQNAPLLQFGVWNKQLADLAEVIHQERENYFTSWYEAFIATSRELTTIHAEISYYKGWDRKNEGKSLLQLLEDNHVSDLKRQYTQLGPHQADLIITNNKNQAKKILSRGQQKIVLIAMKLAQDLLLTRESLILFDDFSAELDVSHQEKLQEYLVKRKGQCFITAINPLNWKRWESMGIVEELDISNLV